MKTYVEREVIRSIIDRSGQDIKRHVPQALQRARSTGAVGLGDEEIIVFLVMPKISITIFRWVVNYEHTWPLERGPTETGAPDCMNAARKRFSVLPP